MAEFPKIRVGSGYDVHRLGEGLPMVVGGVRIEHTHGLVAHSDGDVLVHALCDALLGAAGLGDIGSHFPDTDQQWRGVDSCQLLQKVTEMLGQMGWKIGNTDCTIVAQRPRFAGYIPQMQRRLAEVMGLETDSVNIKATTTEKLGFEGREEGISAMATALLFQ